MGKYMRKCKGAAGESSSKAPAVPLGVRTRSRVAAVVGGAVGVAKRRKQATTTARAVKEALRGGSGDGCCYLNLRSRKLFMATAVVAPRGVPGAEEASPAATTLADSGASWEAVVAGISRHSSTASSVDLAARERNNCGEAEVCESRDVVESSVSDSGCGDRERRETTPSSQSPADSSDLESSHAGDEQKHQRMRSPAIRTATGAATFQFEARAAKMPPAAEIEEFFAAAEKAEAERFAAKYNFDIALGVPLHAGRFEWTPVASV